MNQEDIKNLIKGLEPYLNLKIKENTVAVKNSTEKENSNLVYSLKEVFQNELKEQKEHIMEIKEHIKDVKQKVEFQNDKIFILEKEIGLSPKEPSKISKIEKTVSDLVYWKISIVAFFTGLTFLGAYFVYTTRVVFKKEVIDIIKSEEAKQFIDTAVEQALLKYEIEYQPYEER